MKRISAAICTGALLLTAIIACGSDYGGPNDPSGSKPDGAVLSDGGSRADGIAPGDGGASDAAIRDAGPEEVLAQNYQDAVRARNARCAGGKDFFPSEDEPDATEFAAMLGATGVTPEKKAALAACTASLATAPCGGTTPECFDYERLLGRLGDGVGCQYGMQCATGECTGGSRTTCGTCRAAAVPAGGGCNLYSPSLRCDEGLACLTPYNDPRGTCFPLKLVANPNENCGVRGVCAAGWTCVCSPGADLTCDKFFPEQNRRCQTTKQLGESCNEGVCDEGATRYCDATQKCSPRPTLGETCDTKVNNCRAGLVCPKTTGVCRAASKNIGAGAPCEIGDQCAPDFSCTGNTGGPTAVCEATLAEGQVCKKSPNLTARCATGLTCANNVCAKIISPSMCKPL